MIDSLPAEITAQFDEIAEAVNSGSAVLFLGAGASKPSGGPLGSELVSMLRAEFSRVTYSSDPDLFEVCEAIIDEYDRTRLENFLKSLFETLPTRPFHVKLSQLNWSAIFTTNYDLLVENAYKLLTRSRKCHPVYTRIPNPQTNYQEWINLFKLMGCISRTGESEGSPVLTRRDYVRRQRNYPEYYKLLFDYIKNGTLIYCGYSFNDDVALDIIAEVRESFTEERLPKAYAVCQQLITDPKVLSSGH